MLGFLKRKISEVIKKAKKIEEPEEKIEESLVEKPPASKHKEKKAEPAKKQKQITEQVTAKVEPEQTVEKKESRFLGIFKRKKKESAPEKSEEEFKAPKEKKGGLREKDIEDLVWDLQVGLLEADVATDVAESICSKLKQDLIGEDVKKRDVESVIISSLKSSLRETMNQEEIDLIKKVKSSERPFKIVFLGFNGSGKTTTVARVANLLEKSGLKTVMAAADTWRAAAIQQLQKHGERLNIKVIAHDYGADAAAVIFDAVKHAQAKGLDVVLADTAGRAHTNENLMEELEKIVRVNKPDMKILIVDSLTGNDAVEQAKFFNDKVGIDAVILTKMDVNEKGGAAISVSHEIRKPILYIGTGQEYGDLKPFKPEEIVNALVG